MFMFGHFLVFSNSVFVSYGKIPTHFKLKAISGIVCETQFVRDAVTMLIFIEGKVKSLAAGKFVFKDVELWSGKESWRGERD